MIKPTFAFEKQAWRKGYKVVIGIDEVGRGCFAGPVVAAAVAFAPNSNLKFKISKLGIDDSKRLKPRERERLAKEIKACCLAWDVTEVGVSVINKIGIGKATEKAMRKTVRDIIAKLLDCYIVKNGKTKDQKQFSNLAIEQPNNIFILIDGFYVKYIKGIGLKNQKGIIKGDGKSLSIAAASIIAKVYRDSLMQNLSKKYSRYGWDENKGYGTEIHQNAILRYGVTRYHRKAFVKSWRQHCLEKKITSA